MQESNPYAELAAPAAAFAVASERAGFLKRVYGILFMGILGFAATLWAAGNVGPVREIAERLGTLIYANNYGMLIYIGIFLAGSMAVSALAEKRGINVVAYAAWVVLLGLLVAPIVLWTSRLHGPEIISQASMTTALVFGGLTVFVLYTGKNFSFLRGALFVLGSALLIAVLAGWLFGFTMGLWISVAIVALSAGYILYYTSVILHQLPTNMAMTGGILLFTQVVLLFKHILILFAHGRD